MGKGKHKAQASRPPELSADREHLETTAKRIALISRYYAEVFYAGETPWFYLRYWLGIPSVVLATAAAAAAFVKVPHNEAISGWASVLVAVLSAIYLALDPMARALAFHSAAAAYEVLYHETNFFQRVSLPDATIPIEVQRARLDGLHSKLTMLKNIRPAVAARCYRRAERVLKGEVFGEVKDDETLVPITALQG
jgi:hypothetical protein